MMAPGLLVQDSSARTEDRDEVRRSTAKQRLYILDELHPTAIKHAHALFDVVLPSDSEIHSWRENAEYLVIKSSTLTASDIRASRKLRAIGKQGVGKLVKC